MSNFNEAVIVRLQSLLTKLGGSHTMSNSTNFENEVIQLLNKIDVRSSWQSISKPLTRPDGSALQVGDRYLDTSDRMWWFWNGTYWLSEDLFISRTDIGNAATTSGAGHSQIPQNYNLYLLDFGFGGQLQAPQDASNYWAMQLERGNAAANHVGVVAIITSSVSVSTIGGFSLTQSLNLHLDVAALGALYFRLALYKTGLAGSIVQAALALRYRLAKP